MQDLAPGCHYQSMKELNDTAVLLAESISAWIYSLLSNNQQAKGAPGAGCKTPDHFTSNEAEPSHKSYNFLHHQESWRALHLHAQRKGEGKYTSKYINVENWCMCTYFLSATVFQVQVQILLLIALGRFVLTLIDLTSKTIFTYTW